MLAERLKLLYTLVALAGLGVLALAGLYAGTAFDPGARPGLPEAIFVAALLVGVGALVTAAIMIRRHFRQIERIRGAIVTLAGDENAVLPVQPAGECGRELERLWLALGDLSARYARIRALPDERLQAALAAVGEAIVVITERGQVSLVNAGAKRLLGDERVRVGTSVFAALDRPGVLEAVRRAERLERPVDAELTTVDGVPLSARVAPFGTHGGAVLSFAAGEAAEHAFELEHALDLHDTPPPPGEVGDDSPLDDLAMVVVDTETTGLDVEEARIVSIGAVRLHGAKVYRSVTMDRLVRPGVAIPARSTAVHGITDDMVADAEPFPDAFGDLCSMVQGAVLLGHNVGFDVGVLDRECRRHGLHWRPPPALDTLLLAGALLPEQDDLRLEALAGALGVDVQGRHTALGDCLVTAQVFIRMLPLLHDRNAATLGAARALAESRGDLVRMQRDSGW
jgi:DNA polymerase-3 subunit epsilon